MRLKPFRSPSRIISLSGSCHDILVGPWSLAICVRWFKTIQFKERKLLTPIVRLPPGHLLCTCTGYERHVGLFPAPPSPPAFLYSKGARTSPITHTVFTPKSRRSLCSAGLKPTQYSGHSFCRGGATYAFLCGAPVELISPQGDWSSDALPLYIARPLERCISMAYLIEQNIV